MAKEETPDPKEKNANPLPPPIEESTSSQTKKPAEDQEHSTDINRPVWWKNKDFREIALIIATTFLATFTAWMAWETHKLASDSRDQANATLASANATEKSAVAAESSIILTKKSVVIAESSIVFTERNARNQIEITKAELRAYIDIDIPTISGTKVGEIPKSTIVIRNIGKTPAYRITISHSFKIGSGVYEHELNDVKTTPSDTGFFLGAGEFTSFDFYLRQLDNIDSISMKSGKWTFYLFCYVTYEDKFHDIQFIEACYVYDPGRQAYIGLRKCSFAS